MNTPPQEGLNRQTESSINVLSSDQYFNEHLLLNLSLNAINAGIVVQHYTKENQIDYLFVSEKAKRIFESEDIFSAPLWNAEEEERWNKQTVETRSAKDFDRIIKTPAGDLYRWILVHKEFSSLQGDGYLLVSTYVDVTSPQKNKASALESLTDLGIIIEAHRSILSYYLVAENCFYILQPGKSNIFQKSTISLEDSFQNIHPQEREKFKTAYQSIIAGDEEQLHFEARIYNRAYNNYRYYDLFFGAIRNAKNEVIKVIGIQRDIQTAKESQRRYEDLFSLSETLYDALPLGVEVYDIEGRLITVNNKNCELLGISDKKEALCLSLENELFVPASSYERLKRGESFSETIKYDFDLIRITQNFPTKHTGCSYFHVKYAPTRDPEGKINGYILINNDTTEQYMREEAIQELSKNLDLAFEAGDIAAWIYHPKEQIFKTLKGNAIAGKGLTIAENQEILHPEDREPQEKVIAKLIGGEQDSAYTVFRYLHPDGTYHIYESRMVAKKENGITVSITGTQKDITKDSFYQNQLQLLNQQNELILNNINCGIAYLDKNFNLLWQNINTCFSGEKYNGRIVNYELNKPCYESGNRLPLSCDSCPARKAMLLGEIQIAIQEDDQGFIYEQRAIPLKSKEGETEGVIIRIEDITERTKLNKELTKTQEEVLFSNQILSEILDNMPCLMYVKDVDNAFRYIRANRYFCDYLNLTEEEIVGKQSEDIFGADNAATSQHYDRMAVESGKTISYEDRMMLNGKTTYWHFIRSTLTIANGHTYCVGIATDITALKETQERADRSNLILNEILDRIPGGMYIKETENFHYIRANNAFCQITGCSQEQIIGSTDFDIFDQKSAELYRSYDEMLVGGEQIVSYDQTMEVNGKTIHWHIIKSIIKTIDRTLIVGISTDISKFHEITEELQQAKEKAEQSDRLKSAFLANMSHEIRTPLNAIVGFSELLQITDDPQERASYMNIVMQNNELLLRLISDVLDLSKIESGMMELKIEKFDLSCVFEDTYIALKQRCNNPKVAFQKTNPYKKCIVSLDKNRLTQVGTNFITNAIKYTQEGHIRMGYQYAKGGIGIYVEDTGIGIPEEKQHLAFERFEKLDNFAQGTGLGLAICKAIIEVCQGKIGLKSEVGKGSLFWAWFPCEAEIEINETIHTMESQPEIISENEVELSAKNTMQKLSLLVAEDNDSNFMLLKAILRNCDLTWAHNGIEAVQLAAESQYDAILMDMKMPQMGGLEATEKIRAFNTEIPIIAITANAFDSDRENALQAGCNAFIAKPIKKQQLEELIQTLI